MPDDELARRARQLQAERARPEKKPPSIEDLLARLIHLIATALRMPPDPPRGTAGS